MLGGRIVRRMMYSVLFMLVVNFSLQFSHVYSEITINDIVYDEISDELKDQLFGRASMMKSSYNEDCNCDRYRSVEEDKQRTRVRLLEKQISLLSTRVLQLEKALHLATTSISSTSSSQSTESSTPQVNLKPNQSQQDKSIENVNSSPSSKSTNLNLNQKEKDKEEGSAPIHKTKQRYGTFLRGQSNNKKSSTSTSSAPVTDSTLTTTTSTKDPVIGLLVCKKGDEGKTKQIIDSLRGQLDKIFLYVTGYTSSVASIHSEPLPAFLTLESSWVHIYFPPDHNESDSPRLTGKWHLLQPEFHLLPKPLNSSSSQHYIIPLEDHIFYPKNYVSSLIEAIERLDKKAVVGYSGRILVSPFESFGTSTEQLDWSEELSENTPVHLLNVETMAFHSSTFEVPIYTKLFDVNENGLGCWKIEDVVLSLMAQRQGLPLIVLEHPPGWITDSTSNHNHSSHNSVDNNSDSKPDVVLATSLIKKTSKDWKRRTVKPIR